MKKVMPKRNMDKIAMCPGAKGAKNGKGDIMKCPYASQYFQADKVPHFLGGKPLLCPVPPPPPSRPTTRTPRPARLEAQALSSLLLAP